MSVRFTGFDRPRVIVVADPEWLLAPLFARQAGEISADGPDLPGSLVERVPPSGLRADPQAAADWPRWWSAAVAFHPGGPPPRQSDLVAFSPALSRLWSQMLPGFDRWAAARPSPSADARLEVPVIDAINHPALHTLRILQIPVDGELLMRPGRDRLVVSPATRHTDHYREVLTEIFTR